MAIAYAETVANPWWCSCSSADRDELKLLPVLGREDVPKFYERFLVKAGVNKQKFPRFKFDPELFERVCKDSFCEDLDLLDKIALACRWGMFAKPAWLLCLGEETTNQRDYLHAFNSSPAKQIAVCVADLDEYIPNSGGDFALAASRYHEEWTETQPSKFGDKCARIAERFFERGCE